MDEDVAFARDIRPLFSDRDVGSMSRFFDLSSYDDVRANAERIYQRLADGTMPATDRGRRTTSSAFAPGWTTGSPRRFGAAEGPSRAPPLFVPALRRGVGAACPSAASWMTPE
jgi:hypothetical protein